MTTKIPVELSSTPGIVDGSNATAITIDSSENVSIGSGNLLVGTDSGAAFNSSALIRAQGTDAYINLKSATTNSAGILFGDTDDNFVGGMIYNNNSNYLAFNSGNAERMRIDSSGNVGIGTTDIGAKLSVRHAAATGLTNTAAFSNDQNAATTGDGAIIKIHCTSDENRGVAIANVSETNYATNNSLVLYTSASSTLAERMRIDSSGNVGIGTTSPETLVHIKAADTVTGVLKIEGGKNTVTSNGEINAQLDFGSNDASVNNTGNVAGRIASVTSEDNGSSVDMTFSTFLQSDSPPLSEKMRITDGGNVGIGMTPNVRLEVSGEIKANSSNGNGFNLNGGNAIVRQDSGMAFETNSGERMRITSTGELIIGTTSDVGSQKLQVGGTSDTARIVPSTDNVGYIGQASLRWQALYAVNGTVQTSDKREKTNIEPTTLGLNFIKDLNPISYEWIDNEQQDKGKDTRKHQGLIAQEVADVVEKHGIDKNNFGALDIQKTNKYDDFYGMSYDQLIAPLIKAIQEQQEQIEQLKTEIQTLKGE